MPPIQWKFRPRLYTHFDHVVHSEDEARQHIKKLQATGKHSFLPFLEETFKTRRFTLYMEKLRRLENGEDVSTLKVDKTRPIKRAGHQDLQIFSYYRYLLAKEYELRLSALDLSDHVIAYRKIPTPHNPNKGKCNIHFAKEAFDEVVNRGDATVITLDISKFFESLDHEFLQQKWCGLLGKNTLPDDHDAVFKAVTDYSVVNLDECYEKLGLIEFRNGKKHFLHCPFFISEHKKMLCSKDEYRDLIVAGGLVRKNDYRGQEIPQGIPQGSPISDILANLYMIDFDQMMHTLAVKHKAYYRRYSDDILWICQPEHAEEIVKLTEDALLKQGRGTLKINEKKTTKTIFTRSETGISYSGDRLRYLGFSFDGKQALYRDETLQRYERDTIFSIQSFVKKAHLRSIGDRTKNIRGNGKPLKANLNVAQIFHKVAYTNKAYINAQRDRNRSLPRNAQKRVEGNFMSYHMRASKIFNADDSYYKLSDSQLRNNKEKIKQRILAEARKYDPKFSL